MWLISVSNHFTYVFILDLICNRFSVNEICSYICLTSIFLYPFNFLLCIVLLQFVLYHLTHISIIYNLVSFNGLYLFLQYFSRSSGSSISLRFTWFLLTFHTLCFWLYELWLSLKVLLTTSEVIGRESLTILLIRVCVFSGSYIFLSCWGSWFS